LFSAENPGELLNQVLTRQVAAPSTIARDVPNELDAIVLKGLARDPAARYATAREMAVAIEREVDLASPLEVGEWVEHIAHDTLADRAKKVAELEIFSEDSGQFTPVEPRAASRISRTDLRPVPREAADDATLIEARKPRPSERSMASLSTPQGD